MRLIIISSLSCSDCYTAWAQPKSSSLLTIHGGGRQPGPGRDTASWSADSWWGVLSDPGEKSERYPNAGCQQAFIVWSYVGRCTRYQRRRSRQSTEWVRTGLHLHSDEPMHKHTHACGHPPNKHKHSPTHTHALPTNTLTLAHTHTNTPLLSIQSKQNFTRTAGQYTYLYWFPLTTEIAATDASHVSLL